ncbi:MAG TPA: DPP IV N-terminal domain-containing protein, partial [Acidobacteriaceae bacterium]|nr:DPP IV N-terminal domain-containing protein [Acidobacteriaceae bacterium]
MAGAGRAVLSLAVWIGITGGAASAQLTRADFERALNLQDQYKKLVVNLPENPAWEEKADRFVYRRSVPGGSEFIEVDATAQTKQPAFDQQKLAAALSAAGGKKVEALDLPFSHFRYADDHSAIEFRVENTRWRCDLKAYTCAKQQEFHPGDEEYESNDDYDDTPHAVNSLEKTKASPDAKWQAFIENNNVWVRSADGKEKFSLSEDGSEDNYYALQTVAWSPDSTRVVAYRIRPGYRRLVRYIESSPQDQVQPKYSTMVYPKAGDVLALPQPVLFVVAEKREIPIDNGLFPNPYELTHAVWRKDSRGFTFEYNQRGHQVYRVIEVDGKSGQARALITEQSKTFVDYRPLVMNQYD